MHEQGGQGFTDYVAATDDNHVLPRWVIAGTEQDLLDAGRRAGQEGGFSLEHAALADGVQAVNILGWVDALYSRRLIHMIGQRQLQQDSVESRVSIEAANQRMQIIL